jgi:hypothetical protein
MTEKTNMADRRHPRYRELRDHWDFLEETYSGGRPWFAKNIFTYHKEGEKEHQARIGRSYRFNHTREVVDLVTKYVFKGIVSRKEDAPEFIKSFWKSATTRGDDISTLMREGSRLSSIYGRVYLVMDAPINPEPSKTIRSIAEAAEGQPYAYWVKPQNVLDMSFDERGNLNWILLYELGRDDADFDVVTFDDVESYRLWTRNEWKVYEAKTNKNDGTSEFVLKDSGSHDLGVVPVIIFDDRECDDEYASPGLIDDIAYLDRAVANYLSNLDGIIQDQTFSQLVIPAQGVLPGNEAYDNIVAFGTKRIFIYDGEAGKGSAPSYISPDAGQASLIVAVITKIISEIYHSVGMAGERTKSDNAAGIDNSSGVAKAYDFDRMEVQLRNKAVRLEMIEMKILGLVAKWMGEPEALILDDMVKYPQEFNLRGLYDEFDVAQRLLTLVAPDEVRRAQMIDLVEKIFPNITQELRSKIESEIESWPAKIEVAPSVPEGPKPESENQQGQNNKPAQKAKQPDPDFKPE